MRPAVDHSILSPSGRCSKRAREAAMKREHDRLFPPGYWDEPEPSEAEKRVKKAARLRQSAADLRRMAEHGMSRRKFIRAAEAMEAEADSLTA